MRTLALLPLIAAAGVSTAQPEPPPVSPRAAAPKTLPTLADTLALLQKAYREGPVTDRVTITAVNGEGRERKVQAVVYTDRGVAAKEGDASVKARPAQARVDLGQLQIHVKEKVLTALNVFDRTTYFRADCTDDIPAAISGHFPPVPLPQLALAFGGVAGDGFTAPTALTGAVSWSGVEAANEFGRPMLVLRGQGPRGAVSVTLDRQSGRVRRFSARFEGAAGPSLARLELTELAGGFGDSKNWLLPVDGRTRVDSPALLVPPRSGLAAGSSVRHVSLMTSELAPLAPESLFLPREGGKAPATVLLVAYRAEAFAAGFLGDDLAAAVSAAVGAAAGAGEGGPVEVRVVGLLGKSELDPEKAREMALKAGQAAAKAGGTGPTLLTASEVLTIERGGQAVDVSVVALAPDLKVRGVAVVDRRSKDAGLKEEVAGLLKVEKPAEKGAEKPGEKPGEKPAEKPVVPGTKPDGPKGPSGGK